MTDVLPILTFHAFDDEASAISFSPVVFRRGLLRLHEGGYRTLSLVEAAECLRLGQPFPPRSLVITFDDGYQTVYDVAFPLLQRYGLSATVFLTTGPTPGDRLPSLNGRPMLAWPQIREMQQAGFDFGAHTLTHPDLTRLPPDRAEAEIRDSKKIIEDQLGARVDCFAYPYGRFDPPSHEIAQQHFVCACSDKLGLASADSDLYALERVDAYYLHSDRLFRILLSGWLPWYLQARRFPRRIRRAIQDRWPRREGKG